MPLTILLLPTTIVLVPVVMLAEPAIILLIIPVDTLDDPNVALFEEPKQILLLPPIIE